MKLNKLKSWLALRGVKNYEIAEKLGKTTDTVSLYNQNKVFIPLDVAYNICTYLDIELHELFISVGDYKELIKE